MLTLIQTSLLTCSALVLSGPGVISCAQAAVWPVAVADLSSTAEGSIKTVDSGKKSFVVHTKDADIEIQVTDSTVYVLNGKPSTFQDAVMAGRTATVTHASKVATKVEVVSSPSAS